MEPSTEPLTEPLTLSAEELLALRYQEAAELFRACSYEEARQAFLDLGAYSDAAEQAKECDYQIGLGKLKEQDRDGAEEIFRSLGDYKAAAFYDRVLIPLMQARELFEQRDGHALASLLYSVAEPLFQDGGLTLPSYRADNPVFQTERIGDNPNFYTIQLQESQTEIQLYNSPEFRYLIVQLDGKSYELKYSLDTYEPGVTGTRFGLLIYDTENEDSEMSYAAWYYDLGGELSHWTFWTVDPYKEYETYNTWN